MKKLESTDPNNGPCYSY